MVGCGVKPGRVPGASKKVTAVTCVDRNESTVGGRPKCAVSRMYSTPPASPPDAFSPATNTKRWRTAWTSTSPTPIIAPTFAGGDTTTWKEPLAAWPAASCALHATTVVPIAKTLPLAGVHATGTVPSTSSVAEAVNVTVAPAGLVAVTVCVGGNHSTGAVPSTMVIAAVAIAPR